MTRRADSDRAFDQEALILQVGNGRLVLVEASTWSHPRDIRPTGSFRATSRSMLELLLAESVRDGYMPAAMTRYCLSLGLGPLSVQAMQAELLRRFDARQLTAIWVPTVFSNGSQPEPLPNAARGPGDPLTLPKPRRGLDVRAMPLFDRFFEVLVRCAYLLPAEMRDQFVPLAIGLVGRFAVQALVALAASHGVGIGFAIDLILVVIGGLLIFALGKAALEAGIAFVRCIYLTQQATSDPELDEAAAGLATFVTFIGVLGFAKVVGLLRQRFLRKHEVAAGASKSQSRSDNAQSTSRPSNPNGSTRSDKSPGDTGTTRNTGTQNANGPNSTQQPSARSKVEATQQRIREGRADPHRNDGTVFQNREGRLPAQDGGYYREYVYRDPGASTVGPQRVILGKNGEAYFTGDHYRTFEKVN